MGDAGHDHQLAGPAVGPRGQRRESESPHLDPDGTHRRVLLEAKLEYLEAGYVVIIGGGTSNPYFSTDSASALRGIELEADVMLKGTRVDGVYTADPEKDPAAEKFDEITFDEVYRRNLKVMDMTAFTLCRENGLRVIVFDMDTPGNLEKVLTGEKIGTLVKL